MRPALIDGESSAESMRPKFKECRRSIGVRLTDKSKGKSYVPTTRKTFVELPLRRYHNGFDSDLLGGSFPGEIIGETETHYLIKHEHNRNGEWVAKRFCK